MASIELSDLMAYTAWEREKWRAFFTEHPEALGFGLGPNGDGRLNSVGDVVKHVFGAEMRYVQRLQGQPLSDYSAVSSTDVAALFAIASEARLAMNAYLSGATEEQLDRMQEMQILQWRVRNTPRKIAVHVLFHETRHWAQLAMICRMNGVPAGPGDFLFSPIYGGELLS